MSNYFVSILFLFISKKRESRDMERLKMLSQDSVVIELKKLNPYFINVATNLLVNLLNFYWSLMWHVNIFVGDKMLHMQSITGG